ncbi:MAG: hypothetical protein EOP47_26880 [Sphingobacteriaceae bacterium]|nr:MAG: hypothetical protein EOP47_26880 [Sphingobacteriaceae bacterium]
MNQYVITAYDYTDVDALQRRMNARPHHFDGARALKASGNFIAGGAILNDEGKMIGSVMLLQFESDEEAEAWKERDAYTTQKVWETVDIKPFRLADV